MAEHWTEDAERVNTPGLRIIGEDESGNLLVPSKTKADWWDRKFNPKNPTHWPFWLRSRITRKLMWLEMWP